MTVFWIVISLLVWMELGSIAASLSDLRNQYCDDEDLDEDDAD